MRLAARRLSARVCALAAAAAAALCLAALPAAAAGEGTGGEGTGGAFFEPFDRLDTGRWFVSDGWTNGDHQNCLWSREAVAVADGILKLSLLPGAAPQPPGHLCGEIQTEAVFGHGTYEARIRTSDISGLNAAFFTYIGPVHGKPHDEIDVEILTRDPGTAEFNTFVAGEMMNGGKAPLAPPADGAFHTFAFQWTPDRIRWFVNGEEVHAAEGTLPQTPMKIYLSHWSTGTLTDWMGPFTPPAGPVVMEVDWVAFTPLGEACRFPESVLCR
jgi:endo-1,3-1,4-beta-glycanase ExoK